MPKYSHRWLFGGLVLWAAIVVVPRPAMGQERKIPSLRYEAGFRAFSDGEYRDALRTFQREASGGIKTPQSRWIDSICYETMVGECYREMGHLPQALDHYTAAVKLFVAYSDWMIRVQFPARIPPANTRPATPWGASTRRARRGQYPRSMLIAQGRIDQSQVIEHGGLVQQPMLVPLNAKEIVRCTALAIRRRGELLGPVSAKDPLTAQLIMALSRRPGPPNHWSEVWIDLQLGLALVSGGKKSQGILHLQRSVLAAGEYDHPLTSMALVELGRLAMERGEYPAAAKFLEEATYVAVAYPDLIVLEEAFRLGAMTHLLANRPGMYRPLVPAIRWARVKGFRQLEASLLLSAAENAAVLGETAKGGELVDNARGTIGRRSMGAGKIGARLHFLTALVAFQQKRIVEGDAALATALQYMQKGSLWLFHIGMVDKLYMSGGMTARAALDLYADVLRDPAAEDWALRPLESLSVLTTPHPLPIDHWFEVAAEHRKAHEEAFEIADRARRHRFFSSLPLGGRLLALRWILEGPLEALDQPAQLQRRDLLARWPAYAELTRRAQEIRQQLQKEEPVAADAAALATQTKQLEALATISAEQEALLREMAVRREPSELVFPPQRTASEIQTLLPDGHAVLSFYATRRRLYGFLMNNKRYTYWPIEGSRNLDSWVANLLRELGNFQQNHELPLKQLSEKKWERSAQALLASLVKGSQADFSQPLEELTIVPDGPLWYLPFEALQVEVDGKLQPLIARFRVRYAPTSSLAVPMALGRNPIGATGVVLGRLFPRDDDEIAQRAFTQLARAVPGAVALGTPLPGPSAIYAGLFERLIVLDDLGVTGQSPYAWVPMSLDRNKSGNTLGDWMSLPWGGPREIILPGYHTAAEDALKRRSGAGGDEVFFSVCGLMAGGARTLLLSRWRTGGQTSFDLVREFVQELPHTSPADAWQRAVFMVTGSRLNLDAEPRVHGATDQETPTAKHPFFWAGYLLVDPGVAAEKRPDTKEKPFLRFDRPRRPVRKRDRPGRRAPTTEVPTRATDHFPRPMPL